MSSVIPIPIPIPGIGIGYTDIGRSLIIIIKFELNTVADLAC